jgi:hypothetical protein
MLTGRCDEPPTWRHFGGMYFDQALLLLYLRITLFRFSYELSQLSSHARRQHKNAKAMEELAENFESLRQDFALFTNLYQFPLLSNQQQGIELYTLCRQRMDVKELFDEVQAEIDATHEFLSLCAQTKLADLSSRLAVVGTAGLLIGLVLAAFGVSDFATGPVLQWLSGSSAKPDAGFSIVLFQSISGSSAKPDVEFWVIALLIVIFLVVFGLLLGLFFLLSKRLFNFFNGLSRPSSRTKR